MDRGRTAITSKDHVPQDAHLQMTSSEKVAILRSANQKGDPGRAQRRVQCSAAQQRKEGLCTFAQPTHLGWPQFGSVRFLFVQGTVQAVRFSVRTVPLARVLPLCVSRVLNKGGGYRFGS